MRLLPQNNEVKTRKVRVKTGMKLPDSKEIEEENKKLENLKRSKLKTREEFLAEQEKSLNEFRDFNKKERERIIQERKTEFEEANEERLKISDEVSLLESRKEKALEPIKKREEELILREQELILRENNLTNQEKKTKTAEQEANRRSLFYEPIKNREDDLIIRERRVIAQENNLADQEQKINKLSSLYEGKFYEITKIKRFLDEKEKELIQRKKDYIAFIELKEIKIKKERNKLRAYFEKLNKQKNG